MDFCAMIHECAATRSERDQLRQWSHGDPAHAQLMLSLTSRRAKRLAAELADMTARFRKELAAKNDALARADRAEKALKDKDRARKSPDSAD